MVWYDMVWYGMVWYGMAWYGMVWYGMAWYGMVWYGMVWYGTVRYGMVWCDDMVCLCITRGKTSVRDVVTEDHNCLSWALPVNLVACAWCLFTMVLQGLAPVCLCLALQQSA